MLASITSERYAFGAASVVWFDCVSCSSDDSERLLLRDMLSIFDFQPFDPGQRSCRILSITRSIPYLRLSKRYFTKMAQVIPVEPPTKRARTTPLIGTHSGTFHADEALAVHLVRKLEPFKNADLVRTRDPKILEDCDIVVDVGGVYDDSAKRYDHHQRGFDETFGASWKTKLSSAGLIYKHYGKDIIASHLSTSLDDPSVSILYERVYGDFIEGLDGIDNGITQYEATQPGVEVRQKYKSRTGLSARVGGLNPAWNEPYDDTILDAQFLKASALTGEEFYRALDYAAKAWLPARKIVEDAFNARSSGPHEQILVFESSAPWKEHLFDIEREAQLREDKQILFVLYSEGASGKWRVQAVPKSPESFENRKGLPEPWRGVRDDALSKLTGIDGCIFVHASGFIGGNQTKAGAVEMAVKAISA